MKNWLASWRQARLRRAESAQAFVPPLHTPSPKPGWLRRGEAIMGTSVDVELWSADARHAQACAELVIDEMHRINRRMSPHLADSELARINREAAQHAVPLSEEMFTLLSQALSWSARTDGAFDISFASVGQHYDYRQGRRPNAATLAQARQAIGWQHLALDAQRRSLRFLKPGMRIDLGGFAKGHAVNNAIAILKCGEVLALMQGRVPKNLA